MLQLLIRLSTERKGCTVRRPCLYWCRWYTGQCHTQQSITNVTPFFRTDYCQITTLLYQTMWWLFWVSLTGWEIICPKHTWFFYVCRPPMCDSLNDHTVLTHRLSEQQLQFVSQGWPIQTWCGMCPLLNCVLSWPPIISSFYLKKMLPTPMMLYYLHSQQEHMSMELELMLISVGINW